MRPPTLTQLSPSRPIFMSCGSAGPINVIGLALPLGVLPMCSSLGSRCMPATGCSEQRLGNTPAPNLCQAFFSILRGGSLLSSVEDRRFECRTTHIPRLPAA